MRRKFDVYSGGRSPDDVNRASSLISRTQETMRERLRDLRGSPRDAERQPRPADGDREQAAEDWQPGSISQEINRPERARREVKVQHHQEPDDRGHARPEADDERESRRKLSERHEPGKERRAGDAHRLEYHRTIGGAFGRKII